MVALLLVADGSEAMSEISAPHAIPGTPSPEVMASAGETRIPKVFRALCRAALHFAAL